MPAWLRWILVLPAALLAYLGIQIVNALASLIGPLPQAMADVVIPWFNSFVGPAAFVGAGAMTAPSRSRVVPLLLSFINIIGLVFSATFGGGAYDQTTLWGQVMLGVVGALVAWKIVSEHHQGGRSVEMDMQEITSRLQEEGCKIARTQVNSQGRLVHLVQPWGVAMFQEDIVDILHGRASIQAVVKRNKGADLADPWPVA